MNLDQNHSLCTTADNPKKHSTDRCLMPHNIRTIIQISHITCKRKLDNKNTYRCSAPSEMAGLSPQSHYPCFWILLDFLLQHKKHTKVTSMYSFINGFPVPTTFLMLFNIIYIQIYLTQLVHTHQSASVIQNSFLIWCSLYWPCFHYSGERCSSLETDALMTKT